MEPLKLITPETVTWRYDREADALYISFGRPRPSMTSDLGGGLLARYLEENGEITGLTIMGVSKVTKSAEV